MSAEVKWIDGLDEETSAAEATEITEIDFGTVNVYPNAMPPEDGQAEAEFKIGNVGTDTMENVKVLIGGEDTDAVSWKSLSLDGDEFSAELSIPDILADGISDPITIKTAVPADATPDEYTTELFVEFDIT